jgi:hypothetical protein
MWTSALVPGGYTTRHLLRLSRLTTTSFRRIRVEKRQFSSQFYKVADNISRFQKDVESSSSQSIIGEIIDHAVDLKNVRPGETIDLPYELTVASSMRDFWQSAFYSHDRINTSTPFARSLGFQSEVIPFGLMLFLASSMSHVDYAKLENGHSNGKYLWPVFAGDTLKKKFVILSLRPTSDGRHSIFRIHCEMKNQRGIVVFTCEKTMLFPFQVVRPSEVEVENNAAQKTNKFLEHLIQKADVLQTLGSQTLTSLRAGQLIIHTLTRPLSETQCMQLSSLARLTHERHFNTRLFRKEEMFVPGGLVLGLTCSLASRDLHEVEEMRAAPIFVVSLPYSTPLLTFDCHEFFMLPQSYPRSLSTIMISRYTRRVMPFF